MYENLSILSIQASPLCPGQWETNAVSLGYGGPPPLRYGQGSRKKSAQSSDWSLC